MADSSTKEIIVWGGAAVLLWYLYENGYLAAWTGIASLAPAPATTPVSGTMTTPVPSSPPATSTTPTTTPTTPTTTTATTTTPTPPASSGLTVADAAQYP